MQNQKKILIAGSLITLMFIGMAATRPTDDSKPKRNLKVLPKDISNQDLGKTMHAWEKALGVNCGFCHARSADSTQHHLDFASDAKPEKDIARGMYKMTAKINKKYFSMNKDAQGVMIPTVECMTCHHGNAHPEGSEAMEGGEQPHHNVQQPDAQQPNGEHNGQQGGDNH